MKKILIFSLSLFLIGCDLFSSKEEEEKEKAERIEKYEKQRILNLNKNFEYHCLRSSILHDINKDTVAIILKEILVNYSDIRFQGNTKKIIKEEFEFDRNEISKLDFINQTQRKFKIDQKLIVLVLNDVEYLYKIDDLEDNINYLNNLNDEIQEELKKLKDE